jgi:hypothetical protein
LECKQHVGNTGTKYNKYVVDQCHSSEHVLLESDCFSQGRTCLPKKDNSIYLGYVDQEEKTKLSQFLWSVFNYVSVRDGSKKCKRNKETIKVDTYNIMLLL